MTLGSIVMWKGMDWLLEEEGQGLTVGDCRPSDPEFSMTPSLPE